MAVARLPTVFLLSIWSLLVEPIPLSPSAWRDPRVHSYAALGDSYAAGAGAGHLILPPNRDFGCGRYSDAYPVQVANSSLLHIDEANFKDLACGGTTSHSVLRNQVPHVGDSDLVSITVSGNEVNFFVVLSECIYHWQPVSSCELELVRSRALIQSSVLWNNLEKVFSGAVNRLKPGALLLVTGYARFFNEKTDLCDHATFSQTRPLDYLTKTKRKALNQLVSMLNDVIRATAEVHGAVYLDLDSAFEGHRFCEEGVNEPDLQRSDTWFFNIPAPDVGQSDGVQGLHIQGPKTASEIETNPDFPNIAKWRTFHPTSLGHQGISNAIFEEVLRQSRSKLGSIHDL